MNLNIVLHEPEIPQNTGNIARTCSATGASLHLIRPLGFSVDEKSVRRAGLDYWHLLDIHYYDDLEDFFGKNPEGLHVFATTKAEKTYDEPLYTSHESVYLIFGKESKGLPEELLVKHRANCVRIPMIGEARSLNLSNSVAIMAYEVMRQCGFDFLQKEGKLHRLSWD
ncbi:tRNA (cytidine(34)-2'-O)-methyltransferase [Spirochaeta isovalerica]|uniref:Putative tRNA (cytidine(34)-2'-O)-methyltransferase n=1 Tax=Spirochaeta isovalerica TaxID=150 RepID=A0A841RF70_9SPIO|nr:tRNA (cytidine(34)-2'-O)-methyltransferase [Spirochaeta isovalerica]MBB6481640.1 tRNA (cytidine/uridine-2'-O-)-methyltransferase [Spirochaeta isovalerica]